MIPLIYIYDWRRRAPWTGEMLVEQDLILSRALCEIFSRPLLAQSLAFRGGTALHKLHLPQPGRYSEDIDLVQVQAEPIGPVLSELRQAMNWLGKAKWQAGDFVTTLTYRFTSSISSTPMRLKIEINTREHFALGGWHHAPLNVDSPWFAASASIPSFCLDELLATKLRALYQRTKGRDLFDLWFALQHAQPHPPRCIDFFQRYMAFEGHSVNRQTFEQNLLDKLQDPRFCADSTPLLPPSLSWEPQSAAQLVTDRFLSLLP